MKKLIAISVIFALVAGVAFAEATLGGQLQIGTQVFSGSFADGATLNMGGLRAHEAKIKATFGDGESGGVIVITSSGDWNPGTPGFHAEGRFSGFLYWRPSEFFRIQVGQNNDGDFGAAKITGWGFTGEAKNSSGAVSDYGTGIFMNANRSHAFYPGTGSWNNLNMSFFPMHGLTVNLIFPFASGWSARPYDAALGELNLNVVYNIEDLGIVTVSFAGRDESGWQGGGLFGAGTAGPGTLYASFYLMAIDGLGLDLGFMFNLPASGGRTDGMAFGAGLTFAADALSVKVRAGARFGIVGGGDDGATIISVGVLPSYKLDNITAFLHAGLGMRMVGDATTVDWFINPYMTMPAGNLRLYAGIQLIQNGSNPITYAIPFGFNIYF